MKKKLTVILVLAVMALVVFAAVAMAVVLPDGYVYGMERSTGKVYQINPLDGSATAIYTVTAPPAVTTASPNGLAYNYATERLYYVQYGTSTASSPAVSQLYFWDGTNQYGPWALSGEIAAATCVGNSYYYIVGGPNELNRTDDLYRVTFNADGSVASDTRVAELAVLAGLSDAATHGWQFDGDIAYNPNDLCIYGWGSTEPYHYEFFKVQLDAAGTPQSCQVFPVTKPDGVSLFSMQLAFDGGVLWGHAAYNALYGGFYRISTTNGAWTFQSASQLITEGKYVLFTDLASGIGGGALLSEISGNKWNDLDADGIWDPAEPGIYQWRIDLYKWDAVLGDWVFETYAETNQDGGYTFPDLGAGKYKVEEAEAELQPITDYEQTYPTNPATYYVVIVPLTGEPTVDVGPAGATKSTLNFGNVENSGGDTTGYTPGFWSNKNGKDRLGDDWMGYLTGYSLVDGSGDPFDLVDEDGDPLFEDGYKEFRTWLLRGKATNMSYMLSVQMAATLLNIKYHDTDYTGCTVTNWDGVEVSVDALILEADAFLAAHPYTPKDKTPEGALARQMAEFYKNIFDGLNNNTIDF